MEVLTTDILVAGGGVAGQRAALTAAQSGCSVLLVQRGAAASPFLRAMNVAFSNGPAWDRPAVLFTDMMLGGGFVNEPGLVALCSQRSEAEFRYYESLGVPFVRKNGELARRRDHPLPRRKGHDLGRRLPLPAGRPLAWCDQARHGLQ